MARNLINQVAVITGASSGIGMETALEFARCGARLVLAARRKDRLIEVAKRVSELGGDVLVFPTDVTEMEQINALIEAAMERYGQIDILVNNAGFGQLSTIEDTTPDEMREIFDVNFMGTFYATRAVIPHMRNQGRGHIINVSSTAGARGLSRMGAYCVTKSAQKALTEALRLELDGSGIKVSLVMPVFTETEFFDAMRNKTGQRLNTPKLFTQKASKVAKAIADCAKNPKPEVLPFPLARVLFVANALAPGLVDFALKKYYKV